jgi:hypothetical protein
MPKWSTPERQAYLVKLWLDIGDRCLLGHNVCSIPEHYAYNEFKPFELATPVKLPNGLDTYKVKVVSIPEKHIARLYDYFSEEVIKAWKDSDRIQRQAELRAFQDAIHRLPTRNRPNAEFNADQFYDDQPIYYLDGLGISGLTFKPFAKVRLSSSYAYLYVELEPSTFKGVSKSKKRKAIRYGKPLPESIDKQVNQICWLAVKHYLKL